MHDFHCHLDLMDDPAEQFRVKDAHRDLTVTMTTTPRAWRQNVLWSGASAWTRPALGLHPELAGQAVDELSLLLDLMPEARIVGEIGLDGSPQHKPAFEAQRRVFREAILLAGRLGDRVLSIHSRRAATAVLDEIERCSSRSGFVPVLHWFSGSAAELEKAVSLGCWFSVNGAMLASRRSREMVKFLPRNRLVLESDAPFRGGQGDLRATLLTMAELFGGQVNETEADLDRNARGLLSRSSDAVSGHSDLR